MDQTDDQHEQPQPPSRTVKVPAQRPRREPALPEKISDEPVPEVESIKEVIIPPPLVPRSENPNRQNSNNNNNRRHQKGSNNSQQQRHNQNRSNPQQNRERHPPLNKEEGEGEIDYAALPTEDPAPEVKTISELQGMQIVKLTDIAKAYQIKGLNTMETPQIVNLIAKIKIEHYKQDLIADGVLEMLGEGFGFLRSPLFNYLPSKEDVFVSHVQVKRHNLKRGDRVQGHIRSPKESEKYFALADVLTINGSDVNQKGDRIAFENLVPCFPTERLLLEVVEENDPSKDYTARVIDLFIPIGKGQRALIVAPPKTGKTTILKTVANSIRKKHPSCILKILLIDERPEEVTDMRRSVKGAEVIASTFDEPADRHVKIAEMVLENTKRLVEEGRDVIILLDSITRLARAYNAVAPHSGKVLSGGVDANALHKPKRFFGAARNIEKTAGKTSGSLTIIATALIETGSRMDEVIFEEFKGTGNAEIVLTRDLSNKRKYPAIDLVKSGTRKEEDLYHPEELKRIIGLRQKLADFTPYEAMVRLLRDLDATKSNTEFLMMLK